MWNATPCTTFTELLEKGAPKAIARISGSQKQPQLSGIVKFYETGYPGLLIEAEIFGLPNIYNDYARNFYAMHIHENGDCTPPFDKTGNHYNPTMQPHPFHAGDLPPLLGNQGYAWMAFYDKALTIDDILRRSVIIHAQPDDFTTQPSGASGEKIGCGVIQKMA